MSIVVQVAFGSVNVSRGYGVFSSGTRDRSTALAFGVSQEV